MPRVRISTTVDEDLLADARARKGASSDAALFDDALTAFIARHRAAEIDESYSAYDDHPITEPDEWGDLATFRVAAAAT